MMRSWGPILPIVTLGLTLLGCTDDTVAVEVDTGDSGTTTCDSSTDTGDTGTDTSCDPGTLGCDCLPDGTCEASLSCVDGLCEPDSDPVCGDGVIEGEELCDDGDANSNIGACKLDCTPQVCGDGFVGPGELCDDGNLIPDDACTNECGPPGCGDGILQANEECDDGNAVDTDACLTSCLLASCGDLVVQEGVEACDDGNDIDTDACLPGCVAASCGDGLLWAGAEACDDGNLTDLDGCNANCQVTGSLVWEQVLDDGLSSCDYYYGVDVASDGSIAVVGSLGKASDPLTDCQMIVRRYESDGSLAWSSIPATTGPNCDEAWGVDIDTQGNVWVGGHTYHPQRLHDQWLRKYDPVGNAMWTRVYDGGQQDYAYGVAVDSQGRGILVGASQALELGYDVTVRAVAGNGSIVWTQLIDQGTSDFALDVITHGQNIFVAGFLTVDGENQNAWATRMDLQGNAQWTHTYNGPFSGMDRAGGIARADDGSLALAGFETGATNHDIWVQRLSANADPLWTQTFDDPQLLWADRGQELAIDSHGDIVVVGQHWTPGINNNSFDAWMRKYDADGQELWTVLDNGGVDGEDVWFAVDIAPNDDIIVAGAMTTEDGGCTNAVLRRYNP